MARRLIIAGVALGLTLLVSACGSTPPRQAKTTAKTTRPLATSSTTTTSSTALATTTLPSLPTNEPRSALVASARIAAVTLEELGTSWRAGCPVAPDQLRRLTVDYWGFDNQAHAGTLIVNASVADDVLRIFDRLLAEHFPIRRMEPVTVFGSDDERSLEADNTSGFNCRYAVAGGPPRWSRHAYGMAVDVNPIENPYLEGGRVHPKQGADFVERSPYRPGMAVASGVLVKTFASAGWRWGGHWSRTPDYQHFEVG